MPATVRHYTVADLERFPDDGNRYEVLDGVLLVTPLAEQFHQHIAMRLALTLTQALGETARVTSPGAVIQGDLTQLQPDILVYRAPITRARWKDISEYWLAVEVLSPSSRVYDRESKLDAYLAIGVREVWIVDDRAEVVERYWRGGRAVCADSFEWAPSAETGMVVVDVRQLFRA